MIIIWYKTYKSEKNILFILILITFILEEYLYFNMRHSFQNSSRLYLTLRSHHHWNLEIYWVSCFSTKLSFCYFNFQFPVCFSGFKFSIRLLFIDKMLGYDDAVFFFTNTEYWYFRTEFYLFIYNIVFECIPRHLVNAFLFVFAHNWKEKLQRMFIYLNF